MGFSIDRRWATLAVAVALGAGGGSLIGFLTAPASRGDAPELAQVQEVGSSTTRRARGDFAAATSTTTRPRPRALPAATEGLSPATTSTSSTARPTTTTAATTTSTTVAPSTTTTSTTAGDTTTTSSASTVSSSTTSTT